VEALAVSSDVRTVSHSRKAVDFKGWIKKSEWAEESHFEDHKCLIKYWVKNRLLKWVLEVRGFLCIIQSFSKSFLDTEPPCPKDGKLMPINCVKYYF